ncbi:MAG: ribonuclease P protein component [Bryobacterales bacterium]|nr:ribonuclease P protein component [Bryobacterales bacterium]
MAPNAQQSYSFPKKHRLLRSSEFRRVYDQGSRFSSPLFTAFLWPNPEAAGPRVGFTAPRALGRAVRRNRMKRRLREAVRLELLPRLGPKWDVVINPRKALHDADWQTILREVGRLVARCGNS